MTKYLSDHNNEKRLYLIDASIYVFRSWFALPSSISDTQGRTANAVYGFCYFVLKLLNQVKPQQIVFAFDDSVDTPYRNTIYAPYKANRAPAPDELKAQFIRCKDIIASSGLAHVASGYYEADDLIGTLAQRAHKCGQSVVIVSKDKDLTQLLEGDDIWWDYDRDLKLDRNGVVKKFGVLPEQIPDLLAIAGDPVDNVPGVPGIGSKIAVELIRHFHSIEQLLDKVACIADLNIRGADRIEGLVREYRETIKMAHRLTKIYTDISLPADFSVLVTTADDERLDALFGLLGFGAYRRQQWDDCLANLYNPYRRNG